jgi:hypothetical protein
MIVWWSPPRRRLLCPSELRPPTSILFSIRPSCPRDVRIQGDAPEGILPGCPVPFETSEHCSICNDTSECAVFKDYL